MLPRRLGVTTSPPRPLHLGCLHTLARRESDWRGAERLGRSPCPRSPEPSTSRDPTAQHDRSYGGLSALALAVEAAEALCTFLSDCDPGLTAAVRPFECSAL